MPISRRSPTGLLPGDHTSGSKKQGKKGRHLHLTVQLVGAIKMAVRWLGRPAKDQAHSSECCRSGPLQVLRAGQQQSNASAPDLPQAGALTRRARRIPQCRE